MEEILGFFKMPDIKPKINEFKIVNDQISQVANQLNELS